MDVIFLPKTSFLIPLHALKDPAGISFNVSGNVKTSFSNAHGAAETISVSSLL